MFEQSLTILDAPGYVWTPPDSDPTALILLGHPGNIDAMYPRLRDRAQRCIDDGYACATIELPGSGSRQRLDHLDQARGELHAALAAGPPPPSVIAALIEPLVALAVPEWQQTITHLTDDLGILGPTAISGGVTAIAIALAVADDRVAVASLFAGSYLPASTFSQAQSLTIPVHMLLQWDDERNDRARSLQLFDTFASSEKTLLANMGGHTGVPSHAADDVVRFLRRHLQP